MAKIGVYLCKCGGTISDNVDFDRIIDAAKSMKQVSKVVVNEFYCSQEGTNVIIDDVSAGSVDRVVVAACSPKLHSKTFNAVCEKTELNPFMLHMVNIREQGTWMTKDKAQATEKIIRMIRAGVAKASYLENIEQKEIDIISDVLVVGGGIAGVEAALLLAEQGRKVFIVEKEPAFGGFLPKLEHTYPSMECAPCVLAPRMKELADHKNITLLHYTQVKQIVGFGGNFNVTLKQKATSVIHDNCISCMACMDVCPVEIKNAFNSNLDKKKAIDFYSLGSNPKAPYIDRRYCLRWAQELECTKCKKSCAFDAIDYDLKDKEIEVNVGSVIIAIGSELYDPSKVYPQLFNNEQKDAEVDHDFEEMVKHITNDVSIKVIDSKSGKNITEETKVIIEKIKENEVNVYTGLDFERLLSTTGPTKGKFVLKDGTVPQSVAIIHCVGSRNHKHLPYCSGICCKYSLKHSHQIKEKLPECEVTHVYNELCVDGLEMQNLYEELLVHGVQFKKWQMGENSIAGIEQHTNKIAISGINVSGKKEKLLVDMVILATGMVPNSGLIQLSELLNVTTENGYFEVEHKKIAAISTTAEGVYVVGTAGGPKDITQSVIEARSAVGEITAKYVEGKKLVLEPMISIIDDDKCGGCRVCVSLCPYNAIQYDDEKKTSSINEVLCRGCGTCVAACAVGAITAKNFTYTQLVNEIRGALR